MNHHRQQPGRGDNRRIHQRPVRDVTTIRRGERAHQPIAIQRHSVEWLGNRTDGLRKHTLVLDPVTFRFARSGRE